MVENFVLFDLQMFLYLPRNKLWLTDLDQILDTVTVLEIKISVQTRYLIKVFLNKHIIIVNKLIHSILRLK